MKKKHVILSAVSTLAFSFVLGIVPSWAADCGDKAGAGGTRVACACGDTVMTDTTLRLNDPVVVDNCGKNGLVIGDDDIRLNCRKLRIEGDRSGGEGDAGIALRGRAGVIVKYCKVAGFHDGILLEMSSENIITHSTVTDSTNDGISLADESNYNKVIWNKMFRNDDDGIDIGDLSFESPPMVGNLIRRNNSFRNGEDGIDIAKATDHVVKKNTVWENGDDGIFASGSEAGPVTDSRFLFNVSKANKADGMRIEGNDNLLRGNKGRRNGLDGLRVTGIGNVVTLNWFNLNGEDGICASVPPNFNGGINFGFGNGDTNLNFDGPC